MVSVLESYEKLLGARREATAAWRRKADRLSNVRLLIAVVAAVALWLVLGGPGISGGWLLLPVALFVGAVLYHGRVNRSRDLSLRSESFYERGISRLDDTWPGKGSAGERFRDPGHPYAGDLDVFGRGSLFELLSSARTRSGEDALAAWLAAPADKAEVEARQEAVRELAPRLDLREEVALLGDDVPVDLDADSLAAWGRAPRVLESAAIPFAAAILGALGLVAMVLWLAEVTSAVPLAAFAIADLALYLPYRRRVLGVLAAADRPASHLDTLACILSRFEREAFESSLLASSRGELETGGRPPSERIRKLVGLCQKIDTGRNQFFMPIAWVLNWNLRLGFALERWRADSGERVGRWLAAVGRIEALLSLAGFAHEHPAHVWPEILGEGARVSAEAVAHPLLPEDRAVANDVHLGREPALLVVSGSNMSGKSTLLRTVGVNAVLALAGAPVRAAKLSLTSLQVGASMRVQDSLLDGHSRFFAEIRRLKDVVDLADGDRPVLFLLDELLHGTNSKDRAAGAEGLVRGLLNRGAIGLVTTHDLALGAIADALAPVAENVHFEDQLEEGRMRFDYRLRKGIVTMSNALELMRAIGLEV